MPEQPEYPRFYLYRRIVEAKLFIDRHYAEKLDLEDIATEACFSKYHFLRLFKQAYGKSPHQYLTRVRVDKARELLLKGEGIADVCEATGFQSIPSFCNLFKKATGKSPKAYMSEARLRLDEQEKAPFNYVPGCFADTYRWKE